MRTVLLCWLFASIPLYSCVGQENHHYALQIPSNISQVIYLQKARQAFQRLTIKVESDLNGQLRGSHNHKKIYVGNNRDGVPVVYADGYPSKAVSDIATQILEFITGQSSGKSADPVSNIEVEVVMSPDGTFDDTYYYAFNGSNKRISKITDKTPFYIVFAGLPAIADKLVIARKGNSPDEWVTSFLYRLYNGTVKSHKGDGRLQNSGIVDFPPLPVGDYEARVLSELQNVNSGRKNRILKEFSFSVDNVKKSSGELLAHVTHSDCQKKGYPVDLEIRVTNDYQLVENKNIEFFYKEYTGYKLASASTESFILPEGEYTVDFIYAFSTISKKVTIKSDTKTQVSAGETNGRLNIALVDKNGKPQTAKFCNVIIKSNNKEVFNNDYLSFKQAAGDLPEGDYTVEVAWLGKPVIKPVKINHCEETKLEIITEELSDNIETSRDDLGNLKLEARDCAGKKIPVRAIIQSSEASSRKYYYIDPDNETLVDPTLPLKVGKWDVLFYTNDNGISRNFTYVPFRNIEIKKGLTTTVRFNENTMGRLALVIDVLKPNDRSDYSFNINSHGKQLFYDDELKSAFNYRAEGINQDEDNKDDPTGILYPGKYSVAITVDDETFIKEINIEPCKTVTVAWPVKKETKLVDSAKGLLSIITEEDGCDGKEKLVEIEIKQNGKRVASSWGPKVTDKNTYEKKPPPYRFELPPGNYEVTLTDLYLPVTKQVTIKKGAQTVLSRGRNGGRLEVRFFDKSGHAVKVPNYKIVIEKPGIKPYSDLSWHPTDKGSGFLPVGEYDVTISYTATNPSRLVTKKQKVVIAGCGTTTLKFTNE